MKIRRNLSPVEVGLKVFILVSKNIKLHPSNASVSLEKYDMG